MKHPHRPRERDIYRAPLVLCPEAAFARALQRGRYSAAVLEHDAVYTDSFVGVSFVGHDPRLADALALLLNSKTAAFLLTLGGSNTGLKQPKIEKVDLEALAIPDLMALPPSRIARLSAIFRGPEGRVTGSALAAADEAVMDVYGLRSHDRRVVEDVLAKTRPILLDSREERQAEVARVTPNLLHDYGCEVAHWLDTALRETSSARTVVTCGIRVAPDLVALRIDAEDGPVRPLERFRIANPDLFEIGLFGDTASLSSMKFSRGRSTRVYLNKSIYILHAE